MALNNTSPGEFYILLAELDTVQCIKNSHMTMLHVIIQGYLYSTSKYWISQNTKGKKHWRVLFIY